MKAKTKKSTIIFSYSKNVSYCGVLEAVEKFSKEPVASFNIKKIVPMGNGKFEFHVAVETLKIARS